MVKFGPSGNSQIFFDEGHKTSLEAPKWLKSIGLNAYEHSFGRGYTMSEATAISLGEEAKLNGITLSIHAPYYINLANPDEVMKEKSFNHIFKGLEMLKLMQGTRLVFHIASQGKLSREDACKLASNRLKELISRIDFEKYSNIYLCPETMGKTLQIGTYQEIIDMCAIDKHLMPTFDFGHINALTQGGLRSEEDYLKIFKYCQDKLGIERTKNCHIHFSKIEYGDKGEIKHLDFTDTIYGPDFEPLAKVIKKLGLTPTIICESKRYMAEDAIKMKKIYENLKKI